jgi:hypothetical protein
MNRRPIWFALSAVVFSVAVVSQAWGDPAQEKKPKYPPYAQVIAEAETIPGLITLHRKDSRLLAEISPSDLNKDFIVAIAIARGIGQTPLLGGMTVHFDDTWVWQFRKAEDRIHVVRRNVRFRAGKGTPQEKAVYLSYTDSILFSLPIATLGPTGNYVVDLTPVFMSDLPEFSHIFRGFMFAPDRSTWAKIKGFKENVEIEVAATYASSGMTSIETVPDTRGATLYVHYSISRLPETGFQPRLADDRVGYFLTVIKDFSKVGGEDQFVRYINRWDLRKAEPSAEVSPPATPIVFWIEKTVPYKYRGAVRDGILEWNKAFERAGFSNAIEVRQQPDDATWDPEDIRYNTFRWITANAGFAMGPARTNPLTGQILDANIIFDADFIEGWTKQLELEKSDAGSNLFGAIVDAAKPRDGSPRLPFTPAFRQESDTDVLGQQFAFGAMALSVAGKPASKAQIEKLLVDGVKSVVTHEVGHTLGLRHNFKASTLLTMDEINDPEKNRTIGLAASVMDYIPVNVSPKGKKQGDYFMRTIGPYDYWAIEYGYKPLPGGTEGETAALDKIASRCNEPALRYATDEDIGPLEPDPSVNRFDFGKDPIEFARWRLELIGQILPGLVDRVVEPGEGYDRVRKALGILLHEHDRVMGFVAREVGGVYVNRNHKGDPNGQPPFTVVEPKKQREALEFVQHQVFGPEAYQLPEKLYDYIGATHWNHWGMRGQTRPDFALNEIVLAMQGHVLGQLMSTTTLSRILDSEAKTPNSQDAFTAAELLQGLTGSIFSELDTLEKAAGAKFTDRKPAISNLRRNLQQRYFEQLADLAMGSTAAPTDCQTVATVELAGLETRLKQVLAGKAQLDTYTRSHLGDLATRILKVLDARPILPRP